jgi:hypothetical protein
MENFAVLTLTFRPLILLGLTLLFMFYTEHFHTDLYTYLLLSELYSFLNL